jgi:hypothetical protein
VTHSTFSRRPAARSAAIVASAGLALTLAACGGGDADDDATGGGGEPAGDAAEADGALDLASVCPETVVMQQDWQPEAEHGAMYYLVGDDYTIDADAKTVTGSLVFDGTDTGVDIEVRPGGPNVNFQPVSALMYLDTDILIGAVNTDAAIVAAADQPTVAVASQMTWSPQIIMWDPETYPDATTIQDAAAGGAPLVTSGDVLPTLLESQGIITADQVDLSYEGTPQRFVSDPTIMQQGFATAEPYIYENEIPEWGKPVGYQLLSEVGYTIYPEPLAVREASITEEADCLEKLVPIMQQSQLAYLADPADTNALIVELVEEYNTGWTYSEGVADYSVQQQVELGIVTNDEASGVFGQFDPARMEQIVADFGQILVDAGSIPSADIDPTTLYTNEFIDTSISMD